MPRGVVGTETPTHAPPGKQAPDDFLGGGMGADDKASALDPGSALGRREAAIGIEHDLEALFQRSRDVPCVVQNEIDADRFGISERARPAAPGHRSARAAAGPRPPAAPLTKIR